MTKNGKAHMPCTYCGNDALENTEPPVCAECSKRLNKKAAKKSPDTLKELDTAPGKGKSTK